MGKVIRPTYPAQFSVGILLLIFVISCFLSQQIFHTPYHDLDQNKSIYLGMFLASLAVIIMILIVWEEILFPIKVKILKGGGMVFRNHRTKLKAQLLIYCSIPAIFCFIYLNYDVNHIRFILWAAVCVIPPVIEKIISGINNYNDFLKMTDSNIEYKNNEKEGDFYLKDIQNIEIVKDEGDNIKNIKLLLSNSNYVTIDLDEMELDAFYDVIEEFILTHYKHIIKQNKVNLTA